MLPYLNYQNRLKLNHGVPHCLDMCNGFRVAAGTKKRPDGIANEPDVPQVAWNDTALYDPLLTYGIITRPQVPPFRPKFVLNDNIVLTFSGFFRQHIVEPNRSYDRIRYVNVMYFMEDDTITVMEPPVMNSGCAQGRIVRRSRVLKNVDKHEYYSWKDLNIGIDLSIFGIKYHLLDCDPFTKEFLKSNGIEINELEPRPEPAERPKTALARIPASMRLGTSDSCMVKMSKKGCEGVVLSFRCARIEEKKRLSDCISYTLNYFVEDDTITIIEVKGNQEGRDSYPLMLKRMKVPKYSKQFMANTQIFPTLEHEDTKSAVVDYICPNDLKVGHEISINGHRFLLLDCDSHTRKYYSDVLKTPQDDKVNIETTRVTRRNAEMPEYLGFGTPEDSLQSCFRLVPRPPRKNVKQFLLNANKYLRFSCVLDTAHPEDVNRSFILKYALADGKISIIERPKPNSGIQSGKFLAAQLIVKPGSDPRLPEYYTAKDLFIGAVLTINFFRFKIVNADAAVYHYMQEHPEMFSPEAIEGVRENVIAASGAHLMENATAGSNHDDDYSLTKKVSFAED